MRMAFATLVLVIYQGLFIDVIARSLCATGSKSIGIATRQPLQSLPTCISIHHFLHPALPFYTLPSARAPRNTASLYCPSSDCSPYAPDCNPPPSQAKAQPHRPVPQASSISSSSQHHLPPYTHLSTTAPQKHCQPPLSKQRLQSLRIRLQPTPISGESTAPNASSTSKFTHMSATTKAPGLESPRKKLHSLFSQFPSKRFTALYSLSKPDEPWEGRNASLVCNNMPYLPPL